MKVRLLITLALAVFFLQGCDSRRMKPSEVVSLFELYSVNDDAKACYETTGQSHVHHCRDYRRRLSFGRIVPRLARMEGDLGPAVFTPRKSRSTNAQHLQGEECSGYAKDRRNDRGSREISSRKLA